MVNNLAANTPVRIGTFSDWILVYLKQYGPGNLYLFGDRDSAFNALSISTVHDGIVQVTLDGWKNYFWKGDLWVESDQAGSIVYQFAGYQPNPAAPRDTQANLPLTQKGKLSTY